MECPTDFWFDDIQRIGELRQVLVDGLQRLLVVLGILRMVHLRGGCLLLLRVRLLLKIVK